MAMIECKECSHQVSDRAAGCPNCGAPVAAKPRVRSRTARFLARTLITLLALWLIGTTLWFVATIRWPDRLAGIIQAAVQAARQAAAQAGTQAATQPLSRQPPAIPERASAAQRPLGPVRPVSLADRPAAAGTEAGSAPHRGSEPRAAPQRLVYQTTAEQLYRDYSSNAVQTQSRIGSRWIRVSGTVAGIDEDDSGHPVVRLSASGGSGADMRLTADQLAAAAQLVKGESVEIQCDRMQHVSGAPFGSGCALVPVDASSRQVYLFLFFADEGGVAPMYVIGPMSQASCLAGAGDISQRLRATPVRIVYRSCASTTQAGVPPSGCRLNSSIANLPDVPGAQLWRYDCIVPTLPAEAPAGLAPTAAAPRAAPTMSSRAAGSAAATAALSPTLAAARAGQAAGPKPVSAEAAPPVVTTVAPTAVPTIAPTAVSTVAPTAVSTVSRTTAGSDDLAAVRIRDPQAADRIAKYCADSTTGEPDRAAAAAACRSNEVAAWTRLVVRNEFPALDEATRRKCNGPPFPASYVANEICARYELHLDQSPIP